MKNKKWLKELDIIRALSIILIFSCHLHYFINLGGLQPIFLSFLGYISTFGLSLFFFISGFGYIFNFLSFVLLIFGILLYVSHFYWKIFICWIDDTNNQVYLKDTACELIILLPIMPLILIILLSMKIINYRLIMLSILISLIPYYLIKIFQNKFNMSYDVISKIALFSYLVFLLHYTILSIIYAVLTNLNLNLYYVNILIILALPFFFIYVITFKFMSQNLFRVFK